MVTECQSKSELRFDSDEPDLSVGKLTSGGIWISYLGRMLLVEPATSIKRFSCGSWVWNLHRKVERVFGNPVDIIIMAIHGRRKGTVAG